MIKIEINRSNFIHAESRFYYRQVDTFASEIDELSAAHGIAKDALRADGIHIIRRVRARKMPIQGFKIHVSARYDNLERLKQVAIDFCEAHALDWKIVSREHLISVLGKNAHRHQSGKYMTIYPRQEGWWEVASSLSEILSEFEGPMILSDLPIPVVENSVVHFRYGAFAGAGIPCEIATPYRLEKMPSQIQDPISGEAIDDVRTHYFTLPDGVSLPAGVALPPDEDETDDPIGLKDGMYRVISALHFSNAGGVYLAENSHGKCVIKEARPHVADRNGLDAVDRLRREYEILCTLPDGISAKATDFFMEERHAFMVMGYETGELLADLGMRLPDFQRVLRIGAGIAGQITRLHEPARHQPIHIADIKPANIFVEGNRDAVIKLIDFEAAHTFDEPDVGLRSPGFTPLEMVDPAAADVYSIGATLLYLTAPYLNTFLADAPKVVFQYLAKIEALGIAPDGFCALLTACLSADEKLRPTAAALKSKCIQIGTSHLTDQVSAFTPDVRPPNTERAVAEPSITPETGKQLREKALRLMRSVAELSDFTNPKQHCFPGSPEALETNPVSIAYGAAGIGYGFLQLGNRFNDASFNAISARTVDWLKSRSLYGDYPNTTAVPPGLHIGRSGVAAYLADAGEIGIAAEILTAVIQDVDRGHIQEMSADVFSGYAGIGLVLLKLGDPFFVEAAVRIRETLIDGMTLGIRDSVGVAFLDLALSEAGYEHRGTEHRGTAALEGLLRIPRAALVNNAGLLGEVVECLTRYAKLGFDVPVAHVSRLLRMERGGEYARRYALPSSGIAFGHALLNVFRDVEGVERQALLHVALQMAAVMDAFVIEEDTDGMFYVMEPKVNVSLLSGAVGVAVFLTRLADIIDIDHTFYQPETPIVEDPMIGLVGENFCVRS